MINQFKYPNYILLRLAANAPLGSIRFQLENLQRTGVSVKGTNVVVQIEPSQSPSQPQDSVLNQVHVFQAILRDLTSLGPTQITLYDVVSEEAFTISRPAPLPVYGHVDSWRRASCMPQSSGIPQSAAADAQQQWARNVTAQQGSENFYRAPSTASEYGVVHPVDGKLWESKPYLWESKPYHVTRAGFTVRPSRLCNGIFYGTVFSPGPLEAAGQKAYLTLAWDGNGKPVSVLGEDLVEFPQEFNALFALAKTKERTPLVLTQDQVLITVGGVVVVDCIALTNGIHARFGYIPNGFFVDDSTSVSLIDKNATHVWNEYGFYLGFYLSDGKAFDPEAVLITIHEASKPHMFLYNRAN